ncbi:aminotransferase class V-fold PLP-dependent enzyme [Sphingomonas koreensis]|nr:aminotransferase class V-fold PLP-dependent enzyme [Sphingomonas koreensis]
MEISRRGLVTALGALPLVSSFPGIAAASATPLRVLDVPKPIALPDRENFTVDGVDLNAAYTHMIGRYAEAAGQQFVRRRMTDPAINWPSPADNARDRAVGLYATLINAAPSEIAVVPSTLEGENLIAAALQLGRGRGVITDQLHYDASIVMYGERSRSGMPLTILQPRDWRIDYDELDRAIKPNTRLIALSLVSSPTGYKHDLKRVCEIAHAKNVLVYADVIQAVGAVPFDVKESGVDFCCAGMYKWLMGEFGAAFLYVRPDRLPDLKRVQLGWRGLKSFEMLQLPFDPPVPFGGSWELGTDTAGIFEVSTPNWGGLATTVGALEYIHEIGVERIAQHRAPMLDHLQREMVSAGYELLTPPGFQGPSLVFAKEGVGPSYRNALSRAKIYTTLYKNRVRIAPSVYNGLSDIDALLAVLTRS